ncbi:hypothetical protein RhiirA5_438554 [Rhizophagus irregularis]|uniref:BED-type domain-containing protein n=1 Tax=Rhizophagus irregularis TaxID=588596 RepID=A0A2N0NIY2_9GLOM|nr:hypothetical protein RhiirA5_438554 [Rhizophagus irregularis]
MTKNLSSGGSSRTTSTVWSHFTAKYKRVSGNTTNLHKHLQRKHPSKVDEHEAESTGEMDKFVMMRSPLFPLSSIYRVATSNRHSHGQTNE